MTLQPTERLLTPEDFGEVLLTPQDFGRDELDIDRILQKLEKMSRIRIR